VFLLTHAEAEHIQKSITEHQIRLLLLRLILFIFGMRLRILLSLLVARPQV
jgi:hypothetical protein